MLNCYNMNKYSLNFNKRTKLYEPVIPKYIYTIDGSGDNASIKIVSSNFDTNLFKESLFDDIKKLMMDLSSVEFGIRSFLDLSTTPKKRINIKNLYTGFTDCYDVISFRQLNTILKKIEPLYGESVKTFRLFAIMCPEYVYDMFVTASNEDVDSELRQYLGMSDRSFVKLNGMVYDPTFQTIWVRRPALDADPGDLNYLDYAMDNMVLKESKPKYDHYVFNFDLSESKYSTFSCDFTEKKSIAAYIGIEEYSLRKKIALSSFKSFEDVMITKIVSSMVTKNKPTKFKYKVKNDGGIYVVDLRLYH